MKLAAIYYTFSDSVDLLSKNIEAIGDSLDFIMCATQEISHGGICDDYANKVCAELTNVDFVFNYTPVRLHTNPTRNHTYNAIKKRNDALSWIKANRPDITHFICLDTDEFYFPEEFESMALEVFGRNTNGSFARLIPYITPTRRLGRVETRTVVPFIFKIKEETRIAKVRGYPFPVDPARQIVPLEDYFIFEDRFMHHMTLVRTKSRLDDKIDYSDHKTLMRSRAILQELRSGKAEKSNFYHGKPCNIETVPDYFGLEEILNDN